MRSCIILMAAAAAAILVAAAGAAGGQRWADPGGDGGTAPDITDVAVSSDDAGLISIAVTFANRPTLLPDDEVDVGFDSDRQLATGDHGLDHVIGVAQGGRPFAVSWSDGAEDWVDAAAPTYRYAWQDGTATFTIDRRDLASTPGFEFYVGAFGADENEPGDYAPSGDDRWSYSLHLPFALRVVPSGFDLTGTPKAGKAFTLGAKVVRDDTGATLHGGAIACSATVAGRRLARSSRPRFFGISVVDGSGDFTQAVCTWKVPAGAKGKLLKASVTVSLSGKSATRTYSAKVR